jgi:uncharacterized protein (TIGR02145 family)
MKRFILFTFSIFLTYSFAIAQDGVNYQGAATDGNGDELTNQNISIRASVLSTTANGNLEWEETHSATTDQFGLFNVVIGQGTNTTNGATTLFNDMDWGSADHFLKIEMDASGGTNYAMIGTTQMMSVPYALYAKSAGIDSTMLANMIGSSGGGMGGGCDILFPDGLEGFAVTQEVNLSTAYVVPTGKRLYVVSWRNDNPVIDGITVSFVAGAPLILNAGESLTSGISSILWSSFNGYLVDQNIEINSITQEVNLSTAYVVPTGKRLYVVSWRNDNPVIDGITVSFVGGAPLILNAGESLTSGISSILWSSFNGYLADENYFAGCGGGGGSSSSASAVDSAMVAGMIANAGGNMVFGNSIDIYGINSPIYGTETQATEDGFLYGIFYASDNGANSHEVVLYSDTIAGSLTGVAKSSASSSNGSAGGASSFSVPIKKGNFWRFEKSGTGSVNKAYWLPLECGGSSSANTGTMSVSTFGDTLTMNGQSIIVPGISYQNTPSSIFGTVTDINLNTYQTVTIGNQEWMTEDLRVTNFSNGNNITLQTSNSQCAIASYRDPGNGVIYYNGIAAVDTRNICPTGWRVPSKSDYEILLDVFGDYDASQYRWIESGAALKSTDQNSWNNPLNSNNASHLNMYPTGMMYCSSNTVYSQDYAENWTISPDGGGSHYVLKVENDTKNANFLGHSGFPSQYFSACRCIKD